LNRIIDGAHDGVRLDKCVKELFAVSWSTARSRIEAGKIFCDKKVATAPEQPMRRGVSLTYDADAPRPAARDDFDPACILYADSHVIVAVKPAGVVTTKVDEDERDTFLRRLRLHLAREKGPSRKRRGALPSLMTVHRLDKLTSGVLVFARSGVAMDGLSTQFKERTVTWTHLALVHGRCPAVTISSHIQEDRGDGLRGSSEHSRSKKVRRRAEGKPAVTRVEVVECLRNATLVACNFERGGGTNQLRVQLFEQGCPIVGDRTYLKGIRGEPINSLQLLVHANHLSFRHPVTGAPMSFAAPLPDYFEATLAQLRR